MIHITEDLDDVIGRVQVSSKSTICPSCKDRLEYYFTQPLKCQHCSGSLPNFSDLVGRGGLSNIEMRILYHNDDNLFK